MGLHLCAFVHPHTPLRDALTAEAAKRVLDLTAERGNYTPIGHVIDEKPYQWHCGFIGYRRFNQPYVASYCDCACGWHLN